MKKKLNWEIWIGKLPTIRHIHEDSLVDKGLNNVLSIV